MNNIDEEKLKQLLTSFPAFLTEVFTCINLPNPTPLQIDIAKTLQEGQKRLLIEAFRGIGKTYATGAYAMWRLLRDPNEKVLIISASGGHAAAISTFMHKLLKTVPVLAHLQPRGDQRNSVMAFDVDGCQATVQPSVKCLGITSQLQGNRASLLIADDIETSINSATETMRAKIIEQSNEFDSILQTTAGASIVALGTPQTGDSIYNRFQDKGYLVRIWPARVPSNPMLYEGKLAPYILGLGYEAGTSTDVRFTNEDLLQREASVGKSYFNLQYQLDTTLSDADKYPLKQEDLIITDIDTLKGPISLGYSSQRKDLMDLPNLGFTGDCLFGPSRIDEEYIEYHYSIMSIDPSGRGSDEMGYSVMKYLHGKIYVLECGGLQGGYKDENLFKLAHIAKTHNVNTIYTESNFGDGMFDQLLMPILKKVHPATIVEVRSNKQKELRIIDTMEPLMNQHRLVFDKTMVKKDIEESLSDPQKLTYSLMYQLTHCTRQRGALRHDDRLDALAIGLQQLVETVGVDEDDMISEYKDEKLNEALGKWMDDIEGSWWR